MAWTFGNPAFDAAYDRWRTACPPEYDEEDYDPEDEEGGVTDE